MKFDINKVEVIEVSNVKHWDYPDYEDAYVSIAEYDGEKMSGEMLNELNDSHYKHELVEEYIN